MGIVTQLTSHRSSRLSGTNVSTRPEHSPNSNGNKIEALCQGNQVISRVIKTYQVGNCPCIFEAPTVADIAVVILQNQAKKAPREDIDRILAELEALSEEQAKRLLADESPVI